jgi:hypothetical protein
VGGLLSCFVDYILQDFNTLFLTRFKTYKIATPPQTKSPVKTTFGDWCLYSFVLRPWIIHSTNYDAMHSLLLSLPEFSATNLCIKNSPKCFKICAQKLTVLACRRPRIKLVVFARTTNSHYMALWIYLLTEAVECL